MRKEFTKKGKIIMSAVFAVLMLLFIVLQIILPDVLLYPFAILLAVFVALPWFCGYLDKVLKQHEKEKPKAKPSQRSSSSTNDEMPWELEMDIMDDIISDDEERGFMKKSSLIITCVLFITILVVSYDGEGTGTFTLYDFISGERTDIDLSVPLSQSYNVSEVEGKIVINS